jgi:carbon-monoxide dehydrogenase small subunit
MARHLIGATINRDEVEFTCRTEQSLLDVLRHELYMSGTKNGCGSGDCGACTVVLDGRPVNACLVLGVEVGGTEIETIEGMAKGNQLHPLQIKFLDHAALQCGICTPGMLMMAKTLIDKNPDPTESEVRFGLAGNLCRCTGYDKIVRAVLDAAAEMRASGS